MVGLTEYAARGKSRSAMSVERLGRVLAPRSIEGQKVYLARNPSGFSTRAIREKEYLPSRRTCCTVLLSRNTRLLRASSTRRGC